MSNVAIELKQLTKRFDEVIAVDNIDMQVPPGAFLVLLGPSGCGKTTTLRMLAGLESLTDGEIYLNNTQVAAGSRGMLVPPGERDAGMVFQSYALWPHMTVYQNVEWPLKVKGWSRTERDRRIHEVLAMLDIEPLTARYPSEISGGQQQRVAIARTIAPRPKILLFDEPLSNLDAKLRAEMRTELLRIHRLTGATSVYVTHDQVEAMTMATHIAVMRNGRIEQFGSPLELLDEPNTPFVANFIGTPPANLVRAEVQAGRYIYRDLDLGLAANGTSSTDWLMYRAEMLSLYFEGGERRLPVEFAEATPVAGRAIITVWADTHRFNVVTEKLLNIAPGQPLYLEFPPEPLRTYADNQEQF